MQVCYVEVDAEENKNPKTELDEGEHVEVVMIDKSNLMKTLEEYSKNGISIDAKLYTYALN